MAGRGRLNWTVDGGGEVERWWARQWSGSRLVSWSPCREVDVWSGGSGGRRCAPSSEDLRSCGTANGGQSTGWLSAAGGGKRGGQQGHSAISRRRARRRMSFQDATTG
jgi:hypothetical protein